MYLFILTYVASKLFPAYSIALPPWISVGKYAVSKINEVWANCNQRSVREVRLLEFNGLAIIQKVWKKYIKFVNKVKKFPIFLEGSY